ncbi:MAG: LOG family protein [Acidobacteria bacterium]|nr:LOG family protein [Acidobacteriota bacterium]
MKKAEKAYKNLEFLNSHEARTIRILAEYLEPDKRFKTFDIKHTVVFFGSARIDPEKSPENIQKYYWAAEDFSFRLAEWSKELKKENDSFTICSGGGPGIMEAANRGASRANCHTIGLNISIPHEQEPNPYISKELSFEFHYFFMRKLWFLYHAKALVVFPGGFGTMDELFETLTLLQTKKMEKPDLQILLYDSKFWNSLINFQLLKDMGLISSDDTSLFHFFDSPEEGFNYIKPHLLDVIKNFKE